MSLRRSYNSRIAKHPLHPAPSQPGIVVFLLLCVWLGVVVFVLLRQMSGLLTETGFSPEPLASPSRFITVCTSGCPGFLLAPIVRVAREARADPPGTLAVADFRQCADLHSPSRQYTRSALAYGYHYFGDVNAAMSTYQPWQHSGRFLFGDNLFLFEVIVYSVFAANLVHGQFPSAAAPAEIDTAALREATPQS